MAKEPYPENVPEMSWGHLPGESKVPEPCFEDGCDLTQGTSGCPTHGIS